MNPEERAPRKQPPKRRLSPGHPEDANLPERCGPGRPRKGWVRTVVTRANGSVYMGQVPVGGYNEESSSSHAPDRQAACKEQQEHDEDPEPSTPQRIRKQTPEALAEPLHTNASRPPSPIPAPSPTKTAPSYCCCPRESDCPSRLPDVMANVLTTQSVLAGNFPKPVDSKKDWVTYCLPHGKGLALTTLRMVTFKNDVRKLVTWCTCNPAELDDVHPLLTKPSLTGYNVSDCGHLPHECEHVQVLMEWTRLYRSAVAGKDLAREGQAQHLLQQPAVERLPNSTGILLEFPGHRVPAMRRVFLPSVAEGKELAYVIRKNGAVMCQLCTTKRCPHVIAGEHVLPVDKDIETETTDADDQEEMVGDWVGVDGSMRAHCKSTAKIPFIAAGREFITPKVVPEEVCARVEGDEQCACGVLWKHAAKERVTGKQRSKLYGPSWVLELDLWRLRCNKCHDCKEPDVDCLGVLNLNNFDLFSHELFFQYASSMARTAQPFYAFWRSVVDMYVVNGYVSLTDKATLDFYINKRKGFEKGFFDWMALLDVDFSVAFGCICKAPHTNMNVIADGILLSHKRDQNNLTLAPKECIEALAGSRFKARMVVDDSNARAALRTLSKPGQGKSISIKDFNHLKTKAPQSLQAYLHAYTTSSRGTVQLNEETPAGIRRLLYNISSESPACAYVPGVVHGELRQLLARVPPEGQAHVKLSMFKSLADAPILVDFLTEEWDAASGLLPDRAVNFLKDLLAKAHDCYERVRPEDIKNAYGDAVVQKAQQDLQRRQQELGSGSEQAEVEEPPKDPSDTETYFRTGSYYPKLARHRPCLPPYLQDFASSKTARAAVPSAAAGTAGRAEVTQCRKEPYRTRALMPGLFVMHCLRCTRCLGFHVMQTSESPQALFEVLYTRWSAPPRVVVYDNACQLANYWLNREPVMGRNTLFLVDKLHWPTHTKCCEAFNIGAYRKHKTLNSQLAEQRNSKLAKLKNHAAFMSQPVFLAYVRFFFFAQHAFNL